MGAVDREEAECRVGVEEVSGAHSVVVSLEF